MAAFCLLCIILKKDVNFSQKLFIFHKKYAIIKMRIGIRGSFCHSGDLPQDQRKDAPRTEQGNRYEDFDLRKADDSTREPQGTRGEEARQV